jgi:hypothetical protein
MRANLLVFPPLGGAPKNRHNDTLDRVDHDNPLRNTVIAEHSSVRRRPRMVDVGAFKDRCDNTRGNPELAATVERVRRPHPSGR